MCECQPWQCDGSFFLYCFIFFCSCVSVLCSSWKDYKYLHIICVFSTCCLCGHRLLHGIHLYIYILNNTYIIYLTGLSNLFWIMLLEYGDTACTENISTTRCLTPSSKHRTILFEHFNTEWLIVVFCIDFPANKTPLGSNVRLPDNREQEPISFSQNR